MTIYQGSKCTGANQNDDPVHEVVTNIVLARESMENIVLVCESMENIVPVHGIIKKY